MGLFKQYFWLGDGVGSGKRVQESEFIFSYFISVMGAALPKTKCRYFDAIGKMVCQLLERLLVQDDRKSPLSYTYTYTKEKALTKVLYMV